MNTTHTTSTLSPDQEDAIRRLLVGQRTDQIAAETGISPGTLRSWRQEPRFVEQLRTRTQAIHDRWQREQTDAMEILHAGSPDAARQIVSTIRDDSFDPKLRLKAAQDLLNRTGHRAPDRHIVGHADLTSMIIEAYKTKRGLMNSSDAVEWIKSKPHELSEDARLPWVPDGQIDEDELEEMKAAQREREERQADEERRAQEEAELRGKTPRGAHTTPHDEFSELTGQTL